MLSTSPPLMAANPDRYKNEKINVKENFNFINDAFLNTTTTSYYHLPIDLYVKAPDNVQLQVIIF
jgi:hypothetical protein